MPRYWSDGDPPRLTAPCERRVATILAPYDHHRVVVGELWGVLLTADWEQAGADSPVLVVVFHPAPARTLGQDAIRRAIQKHPPAPSGVQSMVDTLVFS